MKNILRVVFILTLFAGACTNEQDILIDDKAGITTLTDVRGNGLSEGETVQIYVLVLDAGDHGRKIMHVLRNEALPWRINEIDEQHLEEAFFPLHPDIQLNITESYDNFNPDTVPCDIVNASSSVYRLNTARSSLLKFEDKGKFPKFPLIISSAGNGTNTFTQEAWDLCLEIGGLDWTYDILPHFGWDPNGPFTPEQEAWYKPGDVGSAYVVQDPDGKGHKEDWIVVGSDSGYGNKPGPILKDRWICTYYSFNIEDKKADGTSFSVPYVVKIAAEIKRRAPHYTNDEIAQLMFATADDLGAPGCDEVYGHGRLNPAKVWQELTRRGY